MKFSIEEKKKLINNTLRLGKKILQKENLNLKEKTIKLLLVQMERMQLTYLILNGLILFF